MRFLVAFGPALVLAACGATTSSTSSPTGASAGSGGGGGDGGAGAGSVGGAAGAGGAGGDGGVLFGGMGGSMGPWGDFPATPVYDGAAPSDAGVLFGPAGMGAPGGPCLVEPGPDSLLPQNWLRPRFRWVPAPNENLFELRLSAPDQLEELVVYTTEPSWTMPKDLWEGLAQHSVLSPITITVRGAAWDGVALTQPVTLSGASSLQIAPVEAKGSIVYWTTSGGSSLKGFEAGDESVVTVLAPPDVAMNTVGGSDVSCIGCHTSTPDGKHASFTAQGPWGNVLASVEGATKGAAPSYLGAGASAFFAVEAPLGIHTYSAAHFAPGDRVAVVPRGDFAAAELLWVDLEASQAGEGSAYGVLARDGDTRGAGAPAWSHDGATVAYVSTDAQFTGRLDAGAADVFTIPYADRQGGLAEPLLGASDPAFAEYYPAFSPDDALVVFDRAPLGANMYDQASAEVFVVPAEGGLAVRLAANDAPACLGAPSPGLTNSWPKWSPQASTVAGRTYYWLIFSSKREVGIPQLYMTGVVEEAGQLTTHGAVYLWNQPPNENNHTPAWDVFEIPPVPPA